MKRIGIYNPYLETKGGGEKVCLSLAAALANSNDYQVILLSHKAVDLDDLASYFNIDLSKVSVRIINNETPFIKILQRLPIPGKLRNFFVDIKSFRVIRGDKYDIFVNNCYQSNLPNPSPKGVYMCMFPQKLSHTKKVSVLRSSYYWIMENLYRIALHPRHKSGVFSYDLITANSSYTQGYIKEYWGAESEILYPICDSMKLPDAKKQKVILHVGRFFENSGANHHKRQDILLQTFSDMTELHKKGWELHFAGSVAEDVGALKYILKLIKDGKGLPVYFHFNVSFKELRDLYNQATIYWHATGYGSDQNELPEKQEHFGISTVEAMSAGAIPVVINSAGQKESVTQKVSGYLWDTSEQLSEYTQEIISLDPSSLSNTRKAADKAAKKFDQNAFNARTLELFETLS